MKTVYEPANALEGHMLQDLLQQRGISSRLDGAQLQGGVGELPVTGFVRVVVDDADYRAARAVVEDWESTAVADPIPVPPSRPATGIRGALAGLALGVAGTYAFFHVPVSVDGSDYNGDGILDERLEYSPGGALLKSTMDRDFDGKVDYIFRYDRRGQAVSAEADDDFDGVFETRLQIHRGNVELIETDTNGDSFVDLRSVLKHGVLASQERLVPGSELPIRVDYFRLGRLTTAEIDTDRDGQLDTQYEYSGSGEVIGTARLEARN